MKRVVIAILAVLVLAAALQTGGCYYMQAVGGQMELMRKREPIAEVIEDPETEEDTRARLAMVLEARRFAVDELGLPDNGSYTSYADLERDYVVWNVFAAPEFSLAPKTWCFPVVGCVAYRGYFKKASAERHAAGLRERGYDVHVGGVPAYSTLGRFDDPVLNTMMRWSDEDLVATLFHELAHQRLFVKDDTAFNESFATAVAEAGLKRWLAARGEADKLTAWRERNTLRESMMRLANAARSELVALYASDLDAAAKRTRKSEILDGLSAAAAREAQRLGFENAGWLRPPLNNARLASLGLYLGHLDAFRKLLGECQGELDCFYHSVELLAALPYDERQRRLATGELRMMSEEADVAR